MDIVLDIKWKRIDKNKSNGKGKLGLSQTDFYQMFAYSHKYLGGSGELYLIYPSHDDFQKSIEISFNYSDKLKLWVVPFDLTANIKDENRLLLPKGSNFQL